MFNGFDRRALRSHPCVFKVDDWGLELEYHFRVGLFKAWKKTEEPEVIKRMLYEKGLTEDRIGPGYHFKLSDRFEFEGFPDPSDQEVSMMKDHCGEQNPLVLSGLFKRDPASFEIRLEHDFKEHLIKYFPERSVKESFRLVGLEISDIGHQRLRRIEEEIRSEKANTNAIVSMPDEISFMHPYIEYSDHTGTILNEIFYNENHLLYPLGIEKIFEVCEIEEVVVTKRFKAEMLMKMRYWVSTGKRLDIVNEQTDRILRKRVKAMNDLVIKQFQDMGSSFKKMDIDMRKCFCRWIAALPKDPAGTYTKAKMLDFIGISKTAYHRILSDPDYGSGAKKRAARNEEDIASIREVTCYKGFKKGIRQIYMLLPKVTGKQISLNRIRTLMKRYGVETGYKRSGTNRKAMRELVERNKKTNLLMRRFRLYRPNEVRLTDVTYLDYGNEKRAYGSASIDPVTGKLICFIVSEHNDLKLALDTLNAMDRYPAISGGILHSDQGMLYMHDDFQEAVKAMELQQSMSRRGNCWDNAPQESFFCHFKRECLYQKCQDIEELRSMISDYGVYYNEERGMWEHEKMTPVEYEAYLNAMTEEEWQIHLKTEEERYRQMQENAVQKAIETARSEKAKREEQTDEEKKFDE